MTAAGKRFGLLSGLILLLVSCVSAAGEAAPEASDPAARLSSAPAASEYWNLTARFDAGYRLFARFGITNEGPGERTAGALWYLVHPDGRVSEFRNGRSKSRWTLSPDRLYIDVASSTLDLHGPLRRLELDDRREVGVIVTDPGVVRQLVSVFESDWSMTETGKEDARENGKEKKK